MSIDEETRSEESLADLADVVLALARELDFRHPTEGVVPLTVNERLALRALDREGESAPSALAARLGLQRSNLSTALRGLESKGLITRVHEGVDGRGVVVRPTELSSANLARLRAHWAATLSGALPSGADIETAVQLLRTASDALVDDRRAEH